MSRTICQISISLDGFVAGLNQGPDDPIGIGGMRLHEWAFATESWREGHGEDGGEQSVDSDVAASMMENIGAVIMGRNMFGPGRGEWDLEWNGWWGDDPPYHAPTYVLTHHERDSVEMEGGTTFHFVTGGVEEALDRAQESAGNREILIAGGASAVNQYIRAGLLHELYLHVVPIVLGAGERLLADVGDPSMQPVEVIASPAVTHIRYSIQR